MSAVPNTRYAKSGGVNIAYQVVGEGSPDLVYVPGWISNVEMMWENPQFARFLRRLASFSRLTVFDKRGRVSLTGSQSFPHSSNAWTTCGR